MYEVPVANGFKIYSNWGAPWKKGCCEGPGDVFDPWPWVRLWVGRGVMLGSENLSGGACGAGGAGAGGAWAQAWAQARASARAQAWAQAWAPARALARPKLGAQKIKKNYQNQHLLCAKCRQGLDQ